MLQECLKLSSRRDHVLLRIDTAASCHQCIQCHPGCHLQPRLSLRKLPDQRLGAMQGIPSGEEVPALGTSCVSGFVHTLKAAGACLAIPLAEYSVQERRGSVSRFSRVGVANARACWIGLVVCLQHRSNSADSKTCLTCTFSNSDIPHSCAVMFKLVLMAHGSMLTLTAYHL